jgi:chromosome segregation protein
MISCCRSGKRSGERIDIIAQPPGKRLQSVQLLSGGEKALTAMALMMRSTPPKPLPARRDRRAAGRRQHRSVMKCRACRPARSSSSSHNRKTMEIDRFMGVTMEERNVSKLIFGAAELTG